MSGALEHWSSLKIGCHRDNKQIRATEDLWSQAGVHSLAWWKAIMNNCPILWSIELTKCILYILMNVVNAGCVVSIYLMNETRDDWNVAASSVKYSQHATTKLAPYSPVLCFSLSEVLSNVIRFMEKGNVLESSANVHFELCPKCDGYELHHSNEKDTVWTRWPLWLSENKIFHEISMDFMWLLTIVCHSNGTERKLLSASLIQSGVKGVVHLSGRGILWGWGGMLHWRHCVWATSSLGGRPSCLGWRTPMSFCAPFFSNVWNIRNSFCWLNEGDADLGHSSKNWRRHCVTLLKWPCTSQLTSGTFLNFFSLCLLKYPEYRRKRMLFKLLRRKHWDVWKIVHYKGQQLSPQIFSMSQNTRCSLALQIKKALPNLELFWAEPTCTLLFDTRLIVNILTWQSSLLGK